MPDILLIKIINGTIGIVCLVVLARPHEVNRRDPQIIPLIVDANLVPNASDNMHDNDKLKYKLECSEYRLGLLIVVRLVDDVAEFEQPHYLQNIEQPPRGVSNVLPRDGGDKVDGQEAEGIVLEDLALVSDFFAVAIVVRGVQVDHYVNEEEHDGAQVDTFIISLLFEVFVKLFKEQHQRHQEAVPNGKHEDESVPVYLD